MTKTPWDSYGAGNGIRAVSIAWCTAAMSHPAYGVNSIFSDPFKNLSWLLGTRASADRLKALL